MIESGTVREVIERHRMESGVAVDGGAVLIDGWFSDSDTYLRPSPILPLGGRSLPFTT